jgi:undecaprenyl-diphosphatase
MMLWNSQLFLLLNAPALPGAAPLLVARLLAGLPVVLAPGLLVWLWVRRPDRRRAGLLAVAIGAGVGQIANLGLGKLWFEPRPFMVGIGHTLLAHAADNGFPSDHVTLMFALGSGLVFTGAARGAGVAVCLLGLGVAWARVYLGVHFPIDVLAGIPIGVAAGVAAWRIEPLMLRHVLPPAQWLYGVLLEVLRLPPGVFPRNGR